MSESVWFEQVDSALMKLLRTVIQIDGKPVKVVIRKPDEDFNEEDYPLVSLYNLYDRFSKGRYSPEPVVVSRNFDSNTAVLEESALPYDLFYQIDFWASLQSDMNSMLKQWKSFAPFWFNLDVLDESGNPRSCFVISRNDFNKADLLKEGKRLFHSFGTYKVQVELDTNNSEETAMVTEPITVRIEPKSNKTEVNS